MVFVIRLSVALLVSSIVFRLRLKRRFTPNATDTSRVTATVLRYLLKAWFSLRPDFLLNMDMTIAVRRRLNGRVCHCHANFP
jgi:hypothetical protein